MLSLPRLVKRGALLGALLALVVAAAALSPRQADAQSPFGCWAQPVTVVQPVATLTGFVIWQPVTILQTVCPNTFIGSPFFSGGGFIGSATSGVGSFHPSFFRSCPSSLGCFFGHGFGTSASFGRSGTHVRPVHFDPCRVQHCQPHRVDPCHSCRPAHVSPCHSCRPTHISASPCHSCQPTHIGSVQHRPPQHRPVHHNPCHNCKFKKH